MRYAPHDYQEFAIGFIERTPECAVMLDMGLGKTSIALTAIANLMFDSFEVGKALVIAPLRVARDTWAAEAAKWDHLSDLEVSVAVGSRGERMAALTRRADVYVINRENVSWLVEESGLPFDYDMVVVDELSSFKSHTAKRFKSLMRVRPKVSRIVGLTGTPAANGLMDLWAQYRLLDMGERLGRFIGAYRRDYFEPDRRRGEVVYSYKPLPGADRAIEERIADITISMRAAEHLEMPRLVTGDFEVALSDAERRRYEALKSNLVLPDAGVGITAASAGVLAGKLSQMANGAIYDDEGEVIEIHSRKLDALEDIVEAACGKPMLLAYWFRHDLARIEERLSKLGVAFARIDGAESIERWNKGEVEVGLIHPASAGHGLNLQQGGSTIVWFSLTWSLELYQQTNARLWRQGQEADAVVVSHIVCKGTIDERIAAALEAKDATQQALIDAVRANP